MQSTLEINRPVPKIPFASRGLPWACAVLLVLAAPLAHAATDAANASALRSNLPAGVTLAKANLKQTVDALHETVLQHHDDALDLLRIAILAREPKQGQGRLPCPDLHRLVQAAVTAASDKASQLIDLGASLEPDCADSLQDLLTGDNGSEVGLFGPAGDYGFGVGFGPGFPGAPGFVGSAPSGGFALPPASPNPVTPNTND